MDRKISARSLFLVQSVLDKNKEKNVVESQNNQSFRNACNDLFDQPSTSGVIGDSCPAPTEISSINKDIFVEEDKENIPCQQFTNDDILCCDDVSIKNKCWSNEPILCELDLLSVSNGENIPCEPSITGEMISKDERASSNEPLFSENDVTEPNRQTPDSVAVFPTKINNKSMAVCLVDYSDSDENNVMDYSNDDSDKDPDFLPISDSGSENDCTLRRWKKRRPETWKVNETKKKRSAGLPYNNKTKVCPAKKPKLVNCSKCRYNCSINFSEEDRETICRSYWELNDYDRQKDYLLHHVKVLIPKRRNTNSTKPRQISKVYYLECNSQKYRVCGSFFEKTLCISNGPINTALQGKSETGCFSKPDQRGRKIPGNKTPETSIAFVKAHIESFPCIEAHYVRTSSKKLYLDPLLNIRKMYELYTESCSQNNQVPVKEPIYRRIFCLDYNRSFFMPKKDQCATCTKYKIADTETKISLEAEYSLHLLRKSECNKAKEDDKARSKRDATFKTITFDLQSVLQLPFSAVSTFYYVRKLCIYNLTTYDEDGDAICNVWSEIHGKRGANEIGSIIFKFIASIPETYTELSMFSDTCGGQNRNQHMAAILLYAVQNTHLNVIEQKFLESGHSHMECDSMHSAIENAKKHREIFMMRDWVEVFRMARSKRGDINNKPYKVNEWKFDEFWNLHALSAATIKNRTHDTEGQKISWLKIKCLRFEKVHPNMIFYRYDHSSEYKKMCVLPRNSRKPRQPVQLEKAYSQYLPISIQKKQDLVKLCKDNLIPCELHSWYQNLPASNSLPNNDVMVFDE